MNNGLAAGTFTIHAQERVVFGTPAAEAVVAEVEASDARRVFVTSTRSLTRYDDGPLQHVVRALGDRHAGTFSAIGSHSPRDDVIAGAAEARAAEADLLVAIGGGSVMDATKAMLGCLWLGLDTVEAMEPYRARRGGAEQPIEAPPRRYQDDLRVDHLVGVGIHSESRCYGCTDQHQTVIPRTRSSRPVW